MTKISLLASKDIAIGDRERGEMMGKPNSDLSPNTKYFSPQVTTGMCAHFSHILVVGPSLAWPWMYIYIVYRPLKS